MEADAEGKTNYSSDIDMDGSTESTPRALAIGGETMGQAYHDQPSVASGQRSPNRQNSAPLQVLQAELDSLKAQKLESVSRLDEAISTLEAAVAVLQRGS